MKEKKKSIRSRLPGKAEGLKNAWRFVTTRSADEVVTPRKNLCVSIERNSVSIAYVTRVFSKTSIKGFRKYALEKKGPPDPEDLATSVYLAIKELEAEGAEVTLSVPKSWAVIRTMEFPAAVRDNLPTAVMYELDRLTPFDPEDSYYGFRVLDESEEKLSAVVYATRSESLNGYIDALREKGVAVGKVTVNLAGIGALFRHMNRNKDAIFLDIDETGFEGALFIDGFVVDAFSGKFDPDDDRMKLEPLIAELMPTMESFKERKTPPHLILLGEEKSPIVRKLAGESRGLPVVLLDDDLVKSTLPGEQHGIPYAAIGGALESQMQDGVDLLSKGRQLRIKAPMALTALVFLAICGLIVYHLIAPLKVEKKALAEIDRQIRTRKNEVTRILELKDKVGTLEEQVATIGTFKQNAPPVLQIVKEVTENLPESAWATTLKFKGNSVIVSGYAESSAGLLSKLEASKILKNVAFMSPTLRDRRTNKERFSIKMDVEGAGR